MKKIKNKTPLAIYGFGVFLAIIWEAVLIQSGIKGVAAGLFLLLLPLTATPYLMWVVDQEGREPPEYYAETYRNNKLLMWSVRIFMMIMISVMNAVGAIFIIGLFLLIGKWLGFKD